MSLFSFNHILLKSLFVIENKWMVIEEWLYDSLGKTSESIFRLLSFVDRDVVKIEREEEPGAFLFSLRDFKACFIYPDLGNCVMECFI